MLQQELSVSMERMILSIMIFGGSFVLLTVALVWQPGYLNVILPVASTLMGATSAYWFAGTQNQQTAKTVTDATTAATTAAVTTAAASSAATVAATQPAITHDLVKSALIEILKEQQNR